MRGFQAVLWISADTPLNLEQSFRDVAQLLGLSGIDDKAEDALSALLRVKKWLNDGGKS